MLRAIVFAFCLVVGLSLADSNLNANVVVVEDLDEYLSNHPEVKLLQQLEKVVVPKSESPFLLITYRLGNRVAGKYEKSKRICFYLN